MALNLVARVHPVALFSIVDSFERRNEGATRVIGTLVGTYEKGAVEVTNCFCVPHTESIEEVAIDLEFAKNMYELHRKVNPSEVIVGWYATGHDITEQSVLIHDYYTREVNQPVHLTVDTTLLSGKMGIKGYISTPMGVPGRTNGTMFTPLPIEIVCYEPEAIAVQIAQRGKNATKKTTDIVGDVESISLATKNMREMLDAVISYIDDVISGQIPADNNIGRCLMDMVHSVPQLDVAEFENMINTSMKDLLMVVYLSQLSKVQLAIHEKLISL
jgi:translation initiation factor 3 subunit F